MSLYLNKLHEASQTAIKGIVILVIMCLTVIVLRWADEQGMLSDKQWFDCYIRYKGLPGALLYVVMTIALTALGVPRQFLCFIGGYIYGCWAGVILATLGSTLGCVLAMGFAHFFMRKFVIKRFGHMVDRVDIFLRRAPFHMALVIRLLPVGSNIATNLLAGVSNAPMLPFVLGSTLGYLPQTVAFALFGSGVNVSSAVQLVFSVVLFLVATVMGFSIYRRHRDESIVFLEK